MNQCAAACKDGSRCSARSKPSSDYCGRHMRTEREPEPRPEHQSRMYEEEEDTGCRNIYDEMDPKYKPKLDNPNYSEHGFPTPFRCVVVAASGGGKSNFVYQLIEKFSKGRGTFSTVSIVTAVADEPIYNLLRDQCPAIRIVEGMRNTPVLDDYDITDGQQHLLIWDDMLTEKNQEVVDKYYIRARKRNVSCIYLTQSYYGTSVTMRKNTQIIVLLAIAGIRDVKSILTGSALNVTGEQLLKMYDYATRTPLTPLIVNTTKGCDAPYRKGFKVRLDPDRFL